ncbi:hypothetical protein DL93DRAFT_2091928 [Clavulina sp. PMI_390]|nr:hypothetical protein DL93DRAFT_2091928 [Clavulina sp. PMI_390]
MFATGHHNGMNGGQEPAPKYFYYRVFEEGLGLYVRNQFAPDKSLGRVDERRVFPKTVAIFKRAVAKHENISLSRVAKLLFTPEGSDAPEAAQITTADPSAPGASIQNPFLIVLSKVVDGVADIVMSQEDEHLAAYEGRPQGWVDIQPSSSSETSVYREVTPTVS